MQNYLVSFSIPKKQSIGHMNLEIESWKGGKCTEEVMKFIADKQGCDFKEIIITSVFKMDT